VTLLAQEVGGCNAEQTGALSGQDCRCPAAARVPTSGLAPRLDPERKVLALVAVALSPSSKPGAAVVVVQPSGAAG